MKKVFFDIETLPAPPATLPIIREQYQKVRDRAFSFDDYHRQTALNGNFGQVLSIGYAINDEPAEVLIGEEKDQLTKFWDIVADADLFIGHHILAFDLPFLVKRSVINNVQPSHAPGSFTADSPRIYDTKRAWDLGASGPSTGLDTLAKIFGLPTSKQGIDGSQVYDFWLQGKLQEIYDYCKRDVELTRQVYKRMTFSD